MGDEQPTSILTKGQREYLRGDRTPAKERNVRVRIRQRVRAAVMTDIPLLLNPSAGDIDPLELEAAFDPERGEAVSHLELATALQSTVALTYRLANAAGLDAEQIIDDGVMQGRQSRVEYLYEVFEEDPGLLRLEELELLLDSDEVNRVEVAKLRARLLRRLGFPIPDPAETDIDTLTEEFPEEVLDEYGTGVADQ